MPEELQIKIAKEKQTSVTLKNENRNIKSAYLEKVSKILNDLPNQVREEICSMSFAMFKTKQGFICSMKHVQKF